jgi:hypothetical protein
MMPWQIFMPRTSLPMVACPSGFLYLHDKNCARNVLGCHDINYLILKVFYGEEAGGSGVSDNFCHCFWHNQHRPDNCHVKHGLNKVQSGLNKKGEGAL